MWDTHYTTKQVGGEAGMAEDSPYLKENTTLLHYKDQLVNAVKSGGTYNYHCSLKGYDSQSTRHTK
jgi:hypothetical protein